MKVKAVALLSGGLDSTLAVCILKDYIKIRAFYFIYPFSEDRTDLIVQISRELGIEYEIIKVGEEYSPVLKSPKYGYGKNINPCVDCRIFQLKKTKELMKKYGGEFIITGEVIGQRPMSQRKMIINMIEKEAGVEKEVVRPLCGKLLPPTKPEEKGYIKREWLLDIKGRGRKRQLELARKFGIKNFLSPGGGCLLTDPGYSLRVKDLMKYEPHFEMRELELLKVGRHFRNQNNVKIIVGRDRRENNLLFRLNDKEWTRLYIPHTSSPVVIVKSEKQEDIEDGISLIFWYSSKLLEGSIYEIKYKNTKESGLITKKYFKESPEKRNIKNVSISIEEENSDGKKDNIL